MADLVATSALLRNHVANLVAHRAAALFRNHVANLVRAGLGLRNHLASLPAHRAGPLLRNHVANLIAASALLRNHMANLIAAGPLFWHHVANFVAAGAGPLLRNHVANLVAEGLLLRNHVANLVAIGLLLRHHVADLVAAGAATRFANPLRAADLLRAAFAYPMLLAAFGRRALYTLGVAATRAVAAAARARIIRPSAWLADAAGVRRARNLVRFGFPMSARNLDRLGVVDRHHDVVADLAALGFPARLADRVATRLGFPAWPANRVANLA